MKWTTEYPKVSGYYWIRNYTRNWTKTYTERGPELVELCWLSEPKLVAYFTGEAKPVKSDDFISAEW